MTCYLILVIELGTKFRLAYFKADVVTTVFTVLKVNETIRGRIV